MFAILQKYDFSSKSQLSPAKETQARSCLRYCKSTIFQANHNKTSFVTSSCPVVCDTAKVRFFKQITTCLGEFGERGGCLRYCKSTIFQANHNISVVPLQCSGLFAILQKYDFSSKSQLMLLRIPSTPVVCDTAKVRFFKQITTQYFTEIIANSCLRYCKSTIFQANHNAPRAELNSIKVVCDTAKVRFFKQITTLSTTSAMGVLLFAILQKYDFSSKSQQSGDDGVDHVSCLRYCKSTIFQANHNLQSYTYYIYGLFAILQKYDFSSKSQHPPKHQAASSGCLRYCKSTIFQANHNLWPHSWHRMAVVCDTAKVRFFKQITTRAGSHRWSHRCLRYCKSTIFQANHNEEKSERKKRYVVCDTAKVRFFKQITTRLSLPFCSAMLFAILQKYDFSSKSQPNEIPIAVLDSCLRYCKSTIFQANHNEYL